MCALGKEGWSHPNPSYSGGGSSGGKMTSQHYYQPQQQQQRPAPYSVQQSRYAGSPSYPPQYQAVYPTQPPQYQQPIQPDSEDVRSPRLNFCVPSGTLLGPFRVEHGLAVSRHQFELKPEVYKTLMSRQDLELQFIACLVEDPSRTCNWPVGLSVSVNGSSLPVTHQRRPVHLKHLLLQPGSGQANCLQLGLSACCCSHVFILQLVHRPVVASIVQGLWRRRRLALQSCVDKLKRMQPQQPQQQHCVIPLNCPISGRRIDLPARGSDCQHAQCFDLRTYLELNAEANSWRCPVCQKTALLWGLEIDEFIFGILEETKIGLAAADRVVLDRDCKWRPLSSVQQQQQQQQQKQIQPAAASGKATSAYPAYPQRQPNAPSYPAWSSSYQQQQQPPMPAVSQSQQQSASAPTTQAGQYGSSYPPTNSTNASSCSTTDPASIKTDLDDLALEPLGGCDANNFNDLLSMLDDPSAAGDELLDSIDL